ncbi:MAG: serine/threonine protein kinase [Labilithrix sp.]|nr:serine/threonine protein kinase [Labilithrix sp.]
MRQVSAVPTPVVASRAARYELVDTIASGGMARVYLGRARKGAAAPDPAPVAVKILHPHLAQDPEVVALFLDEARVATRIRHPNIVEVRDVDMVGEDLVIIMEYVEGAALSAMIRTLRERGSAIPIATAVSILVEMLRGLHAAHELTDDEGQPMHIVHRDVSPHNVLVGTDGVARVTDFGIATSVGRLAQTRTDGGVRGKLQYLAPEQIHRKKPDRRVDVWAAGLVLWECLTGRRLFDAGTEAETIAETLRASIPPPSTLRSDVPLGLDDVCLRALERDPARRFQTAADFADALENESEVIAASPQEIGRLVLDVDGDALMKRRDAFESGPTAPVVLPARFALAVASLPPEPVAPPPAPRGSKLALVAVAAVSLVIGGLGVRFAGAGASAAPPADLGITSTTVQSAASPTVAAIAPIAAPAADADAGVMMELPASTPGAGQAAAPRAPGPGPARVTHPPDKKRVPAKGGPSAAGRPFMPADL